LTALAPTTCSAPSAAKSSEAAHARGRALGGLHFGNQRLDLFLPVSVALHVHHLAIAGHLFLTALLGTFRILRRRGAGR
jgi:hypothetical protein